MPTLIRTITYTGPQEWLDMCIDNAFVSMEQELGKGKKITSKWRDVKAQRRAQRISDEKRKLFFTAPLKNGQPRNVPRTHPLKEVDDAL